MPQLMLVPCVVAKAIRSEGVERVQQRVLQRKQQRPGQALVSAFMCLSFSYIHVDNRVFWG